MKKPCRIILAGGLDGFPFAKSKVVETVLMTAMSAERGHGIARASGTGRSSRNNQPLTLFREFGFVVRREDSTFPTAFRLSIKDYFEKWRIIE